MYKIGQHKKDGKIRVEFSCESSAGHTVMVAGSFNDWAPVPMSFDAGSNQATVAFKLNPGYYEYRFIIDGEWITDESNPAISANDFGTLNSVLKLD